MSDSTHSRLDREQRQRLRDLGWRWLGRSRAKRPQSISRDHLIDVDDEVALVDLAAQV